MERETKEQYLERVKDMYAEEMKPVLSEWTIECLCQSETCKGWKLTKFLRSEMPAKALAQGSMYK